MKKLALQISRTRADKGWLPLDLATESGVRADRIINMENGSVHTCIDDLVRVAVALDLKVDIRFTKEECIDE